MITALICIWVLSLCLMRKVCLDVKMPEEVVLINDGYSSKNHNFFVLLESKLHLTLWEISSSARIAMALGPEQLVPTFFLYNVKGTEL